MKISVVCIIYLVLAVLHKTESVVQLNDTQLYEIVEELQNLKDVIHQAKCRKESATTFQCCISPKLGGANRLLCLKFEVNIQQHDIDHYLTYNNKILFKRKLRDGEYCRLLPLWPRTHLCINTMNSVIDLNKPVPSFDACFETKILFSQQYYRINQQYTCYGIDKQTDFFTHDTGVSNQQSLGFVIPYKPFPLYLRGENEEAGFPTSEELSCPKDCLNIRDGIIFTFKQEVTVYKDGKERKAILTQIHKLDLINESNEKITPADGSAGITTPTFTTESNQNTNLGTNTGSTGDTIPTFTTESNQNTNTGSTEDTIPTFTTESNQNTNLDTNIGSTGNRITTFTTHKPHTTETTTSTDSGSVQRTEGIQQTRLPQTTQNTGTTKLFYIEIMEYLQKFFGPNIPCELICCFQG